MCPVTSGRSGRRPATAAGVPATAAGHAGRHSSTDKQRPGLVSGTFRQCRGNNSGGGSSGRWRRTIASPSQTSKSRCWMWERAAQRTASPLLSIMLPLRNTKYNQRQPTYPAKKETSLKKNSSRTAASSPPMFRPLKLTPTPRTRNPLNADPLKPLMPPRRRFLLETQLCQLREMRKRWSQRRSAIIADRIGAAAGREVGRGGVGGGVGGVGRVREVSGVA
jgi:hypothetical protein